MREMLRGQPRGEPPERMRRERAVRKLRVVRQDCGAEQGGAKSREKSHACERSAGFNSVETTQVRNTRVAKATRNAAGRNLAVNRQRNLTLARNVLKNRAGNVRVTNNWRDARFNDPSYAAFHNYNRTWHDRGWWRDHIAHRVCAGRVVVRNTGYWYPAWGYDVRLVSYDGPIRGYRI